MNKQTLLPGQYMKVTSVLQFISKWFPTQILKIKDLERHIGELNVYFSTADLQSAIPTTVLRIYFSIIILSIFLLIEKLKMNALILLF